MPATRKSSSTARTAKAYSKPTATASVAPATVSHGPRSDKEELLGPNPQEIVEEEKRARSLVIAGIPEAEGDLERVSRTEAMAQGESYRGYDPQSFDRPWH
ncbi:hypothetical protein ANCDUO_15927 [Ancylostoma duodenale]|uniref:Uncharacterized protein n=1 Tax=Ancylostoma duodenale TaxID=51022 RepID=A0A0C2G4V9_9BILA|nr:hypothetical protein ANCDUO_15927 [Ancylostoma duodenale]